MTEKDKILFQAKQGETSSITITTRLFTCSHYKILSTARSMWCNECGRESMDPGTQEYAGYMESKPVAVVEFSLRANDPFDVSVHRIL